MAGSSCYSLSANRIFLRLLTSSTKSYSSAVVSSCSLVRSSTSLERLLRCPNTWRLLTGNPSWNFLMARLCIASLCSFEMHCFLIHSTKECTIACLTVSSAFLMFVYRCIEFFFMPSFFNERILDVFYTSSFVYAMFNVMV